MIDRATGEVHFCDGATLVPQGRVPGDTWQEARRLFTAGLAEWAMHDLGEHDADDGRFSVNLVCVAKRVQAVFLVHIHPFYEKDTKDDAERRAFHEGVIARDLGGQREFSWGQVLCRVDEKLNVDNLIVLYTPGPHVALHPPDILLRLQAREEG